jgi:hypothetical protein
MGCIMANIQKLENKKLNDKLIFDVALAAPALTLPLWVAVFEEWLRLGITVTTLIIVTIRLVFVLQEWYNKKNISNKIGDK